MTSIKSIKFSSDDLIPMKASLVDDYKAFFIKNEGYILKIKKELTHKAEIEDLTKLFSELYELSLIPKTEPIIANIDGVEHIAFLQEKINPINYPFEWTPSMIKEVALLVLQIVKIANKYGYTLKDSHPYNVVFSHSKPLWVDIGSFYKVSELKGTHFGALGEFYQTIYIPLVLASRGLLNLSKCIYKETSLIPANELIFLNLPFFVRFIPSSLVFKVIKFYFIYNNLPTKDETKIRNKLKSLPYGAIFKLVYDFAKKLRFPLRLSLNRLEKKVMNIKIKYSNSQWSKYYGSKFEYPKRFKTIGELMKRYNIKTITDIGGNIGLLGFYLIDNKIIDMYTCIDADLQAIDIGYNISKRRGDKNSLFLHTNPFIQNKPRLFIPLYGRCKSECVTALALTHHLVLSQNYDLDYCFETLSKFTTKYAFIEFMPIGLYDGKNPPPPVPPYYNIDWFKEHFCRYFDIILYKEIDINRILFVGIKKL